MVDFAFFDSGTGGLPYLLHLKELCPDASCLYVADTKNFPYGTKSSKEIIDCIVTLVKEIIAEYNPRCLVIACNTISVTALEEIRAVAGDIPVVGTVPAIKLASHISKSRRIGLLATRATVNSPYTQNLKNDFASDCELVLREDTELIRFIEKESFTSTKEECEKACLPQAQFFRSQNCDTVVLACTHFLNLADTIQKVCGDEIKVVDSRDGVARRALDVCHVEASGKNPEVQLIITGDKSNPEYQVIESKYGLVLV